MERTLPEQGSRRLESPGGALKADVAYAEPLEEFFSPLVAHWSWHCLNRALEDFQTHWGFAGSGHGLNGALKVS